MGSWSVECETLQSTQTFSKDGAREIVSLKSPSYCVLIYQLLSICKNNQTTFLFLSSQLQEDHRN